MLSTIGQIAIYYWQLSIFRKTPEHSPCSSFLMGLMGMILAWVICIQWRFSDNDFSDDLGNTILTVASLIISYLAYTYVVLFIRGVAPRWVQTVTCLFATHILVHIVASPLLLLSPYLMHVNFKNPLYLFIGVLYLLTTLGLSVWQFVITAHIYRYALNATALQSVIAAFGLIAVNILTISFWR
jgi:hypothetical protein